MGKLESPTAIQQAFIEETKAPLKKYSDQLPLHEIMALVAHYLGSLIAIQDPEIMTSAVALQVVKDNIQAGNQQTNELILLKLRGLQ